ncbi:MAG TPA: glycoside hydrolase family 3 C-terminal domain-containing protein [Thermomonospora sp.]|nr:glycoside hydrolase family 3 C-terminal domain-containing protein [Thermomonospora sp.]
MPSRVSSLVAAGVCVAALTVPVVPAGAATPCGDPRRRPWCDTSLSPDRRAALLLRALTPHERLGLMAGDDPVGPLLTPTSATAREGTVRGVPRLGIPTVLMAGGGPAGIRQGRGTALPSPIALGAGFDSAAAARFGRVVGDEARRKGNDVALGPALDIVRTPRGGRSFEGFGEDPFLTARLAVPWIRAVQEQGVLTSVKHFPANNQEFQRFTVDAVVGARALREVYLPPFEAAVREARPATVMCAYNLVNGRPSCGSRPILDGVLRGEWGFRGTVISDWFLAAKDTAGSAEAGLNIEMPVGVRYSPAALLAALGTGRLSRATVDRRVHEYLRTLFAHGVMDRAPYPNAPGTIDTAAHDRAARELAEGGITLLRNDGVLPLRAPRSIALIGSAAGEYVSGGGSSQVTPRATVTVRQGVQARARGAAVTYRDGRDVRSAVAAAREADVAIVVAADAKSEFTDAPCMTLRCGDPRRGDQDALIRAVAAANPRTVVVLQTGAPVLTPWAEDVAAVVETWYPGQQGGHAVARMLFGDVDPGGRLPVTFPVAERDTPTGTDRRRYPGVGGKVHYSEGVFVGYRHYDRHGIAPRFPFGHGLSYTTFAYRDLRVGPRGAQVTVVNTGNRTGVAVPQLYVALGGTPGVPQPPRQLKGFAKVTLAPGASRRVTFPLDARSFAYWDEKGGRWQAAPRCRILAGSSSRDLPLSAACGTPG